MREISLVRVEILDGFCEEAEELGSALAKCELPRPVEIGDGIEFGVSERLPIVLRVSGDDVSVESTVVPFCLSPCVVDATPDR